MSDDNSEGSWIPSVVVSVLIVLWWISRSQSIKAVQIRRWYSVKVCHSAFQWLSLIMEYRFIASTGFRDEMSSLF